MNTIPYKKIASGRTAEVYLYDEGKILKLFDRNFPIQKVHQEFSKSKDLFDKGLHIPKAYEEVSLFERNGIIYERIIGSTMFDFLLHNPQHIKREAERMADMHIQIHKVRVKHIESLFSKLHDEVSKTNYINCSQKKRLLSNLQRLINNENNLLHWDLHPLNLIKSKENIYIIDWIGACSGPLEADVARTLIVLFNLEGLTRMKMGLMLIDRVRKVFAGYYFKTLIERSSIKVEDIIEWIPIIATARLSEITDENEKLRLMSLIDHQNAGVFTQSLA